MSIDDLNNLRFTGVMTKAPRSFIEPGHHSIDRVTPRQRDGGSWVIDWSVRLPSGRLIEKRTQAATKTLVKARARRTAERLLATGGSAKAKPTMSAASFIDTVTIPQVKESALASSTKTLYTTAAERLKTQFSGLSVADALTYAECATALRSISASYGVGGARNAKKALSGYIVAPALARSMITTTPLPKEHPIDLATGAKEAAKAPRGSADLTTDHWHAVVGYLLALDPAEGVAPPKRGRWTHADRIAKRRNAIDQALFHCATGLRLSEAIGQGIADFEDRGDELWLTVTNPKGDKTRTIPLLLPEVADHLRAGRLTSSGLLIPSPTNAAKAWTQAAAKEAAAELYVDLAKTLDIPPLLTLRSHAWRSVINRELIARGVGDEERVAYLGHTTAVNAASYTYGRSLGPIARLIGKL